MRSFKDKTFDAVFHRDHVEVHQKSQFSVLSVLSVSPWSPALARISDSRQCADPYPPLMADSPGFCGGNCMKFDIHANPPSIG